MVYWRFLKQAIRKMYFSNSKLQKVTHYIQLCFQANILIVSSRKQQASSATALFLCSSEITCLIFIPYNSYCYSNMPSKSEYTAVMVFLRWLTEALQKWLQCTLMTHITYIQAFHICRTLGTILLTDITNYHSGNADKMDMSISMFLCYTTCNF
jgi:hypothetical protein